MKKKELRTNKAIMYNIQKLIGINPDNYNESIRWISATKKELLKLEKAIKRKLRARK